MKIWLVTNRHLCRGAFLHTVAEAARAGLEAIILREKDLPPEELYTLALQIKKSADEHSVRLLINGSVEVAAAASAHGVHLGKGALPPPVVKEKLGYRGTVGVSVHSVTEALAAARSGADYLLVGHIFETQSKPDLTPGGLDLLTEIRQAVSLPLVAIGGITPGNVRQLYLHGIHNAAVMSYIMGSADPYRAVRELRGRFT